MTVLTANLTGIDVRAEIERLRKDRNAVILAHYYQKPEIQDLADFVGDSLELSRKAAATDAEVIAFCGVKFMADTAKILSPQKIVVLPDMDAGCSLEDSCPPEKFKAFREAHPDHIALTYINCSTEVKALSDVIVTSSSAETILQQIPKEQKIIFGPDRHLGGYLSRKFDRDMLLWPGVCIVHEAFSETELLKLKAQHPGAPVAAHPECPPAIIDHADYVGSTSGILNFAKTFPGDTLIVATEPHIIHQMEKALPEQDLHRRARCGRQLQLQHLPLHGAEYAGETVPGAARSAAADRDRGGLEARGEEEPGPDAGNGERDRGQGGFGPDGGLNGVFCPMIDWHAFSWEAFATLMTGVLAVGAAYAVGRRQLSIRLC